MMRYVTATIFSVGFIAGVIGSQLAESAPPPACDSAEIQRRIIATTRPSMGPLEREFWQRAIARAAAKHGVPAVEMTAKIAQESKFDGRARGAAGEKGAGQLMPMWTKGIDPFEIETNLAKSAQVLAAELKAVNGDIYRALRRYNGGGSNGERNARTEHYANAVIARVYLAQQSCAGVVS